MIDLEQEEKEMYQPPKKSGRPRKKGQTIEDDFEDYFSSEDQSPKQKVSKRKKRAAFNEPLEDDDQGWSQLMRWGQANPMLVQNYPNLYYNQNILKSKAVSSKQNGTDGSLWDYEQKQAIKHKVDQFQNESVQDIKRQKQGGEGNNSFEIQLEDNQESGDNYFEEQEEVEPKIKRQEEQKPSRQNVVRPGALNEEGEEERWEGDFDKAIDEAIKKSNIDFVSRGRLKKAQAIQYGLIPATGKKNPQLVSHSKKGKPSKQWLRLAYLQQQKLSKKQLFSGPTPEQQFQQIQHLTRTQQLSFVEGKLEHYLNVKNIILSKKNEDETINDLFQEKKKRSKHSEVNLAEKPRGYIHSIKKMRPVIPKKLYEIAAFRGDKKQRAKRGKVTIQLLRTLSDKFVLLDAFQTGKSDPGSKLSLTSIANEYKLGTTTIASLYSEWLSDPTFSQKMSKIQQSQNIAASKKAQLKLKRFSDAAINQNLSDPSILKILEMRYAYAQHFIKLKNKGSRLYYLDELPKQMIFGTNKIEEQLTGKEINFSLMAVLGVTGRASWKVVHWLGRKYQQVSDIAELFQNVQEEEDSGPDQSLKNAKNYLILDSSILKEVEKIRQIEQATNSKVLFLPQLSKQLNPLELWFVDVRNKLKFSSKSLNELNKVLQKFSGTDFSKYFIDSQKFMSIALEKQNF